LIQRPAKADVVRRGLKLGEIMQKSEENKRDEERHLKAAGNEDVTIRSRVRFATSDEQDHEPLNRI
jgi:hypothetical protein